MPAPGLPRAAGHAAVGAHRPAARAVPAGLGAAAAAARDGQRRRVRGRLVRAPATRSRPGTGGPGPIWADASFADLARVTRSGAVLAAVRSATPGTRPGAAAAAPFACGPLAVQPQRAGRRLAGVRGRAGRRRCPPRRCSGWRRGSTRRCCGRWCRHRLRRGAGARPGPGRHVRGAAGGGRDRPVQLPAHRRPGDRRHRRPATRCGTAGRPDAVVGRVRAGRRRARLDRGARPTRVVTADGPARPTSTQLSDRSTVTRQDSERKDRDPDDAHLTAGCPPGYLADALRADARAGLTAGPEVAAAQVVLRRAGQRAVREDHRAARVLPDPGRAGDPAGARGRRSPR